MFRKLTGRKIHSEAVDDVWRGLSAMVVFFVSPHLAHVLDHGGRERRHVHAFEERLCAGAGCGA